MTGDSFDHIIVGAGSAGCVLANRLSENPKTRVLLIEAGGADDSFWIRTPLGYAKTFSDPKVNWRFFAAPDQGLNGREAYFPRGRVIGGSSSINAMAYLRGLPHDFDDWGRAGAEGWTWAAAQETYDALETRSELTPDGARVTRGAGPVWVSDLSDRMHPFARNFLTAAGDLGWPVSADLNGACSEGMTMVRSTVREGRRWSSADAFLRPSAARPNLRVITEALVEKVVVQDGRATGVVYRARGRTSAATAARDVILSAGAIGSPQLLQLSGIGPAALLKRHGIAVQHDLAQVGQGLQDHLAISHFYGATAPTLNNTLGNSWGRAMAGLRYLLCGTGPLSLPINHCTGFIRSGDDASAPDLQIYCNPASYTITPAGAARIDAAPGFLLSAQPSRPTSRGSVTIASGDPARAPIIQPNSLSTDADRMMAIRAGRALQALARTPTLRNLTANRRSPDIVGMDDDALLENFKNRATSVFHASCTCRMGRDARDSVLDGQLRVHGVRGLRVVDASAFPNVTSGNTNAPTLMLASRAADLILRNA